jgi:hypothetical protein
VAWVPSDEPPCSGHADPEISLHYHALLKYQNALAHQDVAALWKSKAGDAKVERYDCGGGAPYYIAKMFPYGEMRYDMGGLEHFARQESLRPSVQWIAERESE